MAETERNPVDEALENLEMDLRQLLVEATGIIRALNPTAGPVGVGSQLLLVVAKQLRGIMSEDAVKMSLLAAFEQSHAKPMTELVDIPKAKRDLEVLSRTRKKVEARRALLVDAQGNALTLGSKTNGSA